MDNLDFRMLDPIKTERILKERTDVKPQEWAGHASKNTFASIFPRYSPQIVHMLTFSAGYIIAETGVYDAQVYDPNKKPWHPAVLDNPDQISPENRRRYEAVQFNVSNPFHLWYAESEINRNDFNPQSDHSMEDMGEVVALPRREIEGRARVIVPESEVKIVALEGASPNGPDVVALMRVDHFRNHYKGAKVSVRRTDPNHPFFPEIQGSMFLNGDYVNYHVNRVPMHKHKGLLYYLKDAIWGVRKKNKKSTTK